MVYHVNAHASVAHPLKLAKFSVKAYVCMWIFQFQPEFNLCNVDVCVL
jgi:hypothetical protein